jgi:hypothetical protein
MANVSPRLFFDRKQVDGIESLLTMFVRGAFASPHRSTVPLVALVKDDWSVFREIAEACGCEPDLSVHFEYKVAAPGIGGNPSQTDAMVFSPISALALEAKWTEPRYETVSKRLKNRVAKLVGADPNNAEKHNSAEQAIIKGWLDLLGLHSNTAVKFEDAGEAVYQMIHRAASACTTDRRPSLLYVHFDPTSAGDGETTAQYRADLKHLHELMGKPIGFPFYLADVPLRPTEAFRAIELLPKGLPDTDIKVRDAIRSTRLFEFGDPSIDKIG